MTNVTFDDIKTKVTDAAKLIGDDNRKRGESFFSMVQEGGAWDTVASALKFAFATFVNAKGEPVQRLSPAMKADLGLDLIKPMELSAVVKVLDDWEDFVSHVSEVYEASLNGEGDRLAYTSIRMAAHDFKSMDAPEGIGGEDEDGEGSSDNDMLKAKEALIKAVVKAAKAGMDTAAIASVIAEALTDNN